MHRLLKALLLVVTCALVGSTALAQPTQTVLVSGRLPQGKLRVFVKDSLYRIVGPYVVSGTLLIEPGTTVEFIPNGHLIDSVGGKIIADGELGATWNRNTSDASLFTNRYCDIDYIRANVSPNRRPEITAPLVNSTDNIALVLFYYANGLNRCATDPNVKFTQYRRDVVRAPITFRGRPINQHSREWGHIVILPGADTAFFRNVNFVNFRKDVTVVSNEVFYAPSTLTGYNAAQVTAGAQLNTLMRNTTSGGGGAMTVFSSKTWILDCRFDSNFARFHGGAVQFLQSPFESSGQFFVPAPGIPVGPNSYPTNPDDVENFDIYGGAGVNDNVPTPFGVIPGLRVTSPSNPALAQFRQTYDDGRMAINRGRVRRVFFRDNRAVLSNTIEVTAGYGDVTTPATGSFPFNEALGGAMYIDGRRPLTVYFGRGSALQELGILPGGDATDTMVFERNYAVNYQPNGGVARGGAIYVGNNTSLHFQLSRFMSNFTAVPNHPATALGTRGAASQGGAVYMSATSPEFTALAGVRFQDNKSGQGGALYLAARPSDLNLSPIIGDSVRFLWNKAEYAGGAIFTQRNMRLQAPFLTSTDPNGNVIDRRILFDSNMAGLVGGAVVIDNRTNPAQSRAAVENVLFRKNSAGDTAIVRDVRLIKLYNPTVSPITPTNQYGVMTAPDEFGVPGQIVTDIVGGGAVYSLSGNTNFFRSVEFRENYTLGGNGGAVALVLPGQRDNRYFLSKGDSAYDFVNATPVAFEAGPEPVDQREMTRFIMNRAVADLDPANVFNANPYGVGGLSDPTRNGTGLGGALYINDRQPTVTPAPRTDSVLLHRVRMEQNTAWSGSAVYSDNYDLRVIFNKSLIAGNRAISTVGRTTDVIDNYLTSPGADVLAAATFFGEIEGPMPTDGYHTNANSIYDNEARFLVRLPDQPANSGTGFGGVDTLRGNFWGPTEAPVTTILPSGTLQNTFYVKGDSCTLPLKNPAIPNQQGPFESERLYTYTSVPVGVIPDTLLMQGQVYDIFDKGRDIKAVDYSMPRMAPIEDFSVGIPPRLRRYTTGVYQNRVVRRLTRDPFVADVDRRIDTLQREFVGNHPIGYPLFLEANANYTGNRDFTNDDPYALNHTVFFVINVETGEMIRTTMKQVREGSTLFRSRVEFVPDSVNREPIERRTFEGRAAWSIGELYRLTPQYYLETPGLLPSFATREDSLEEARFLAARFEDSIAIGGRRYGGFIRPVLELGGNGFQYTNRPTPPRFVDVYAGERYRALPVLAGDRVWVISRTMMWDTQSSLVDVLNNARFTGLEFMIDNVNSVPAPIVSGMRDVLENKTPIELRNTRFLVEDRAYTSDRTGNQVSQIFEVTASDVNGFFDPRSLFFPERFTGLRYEWYTLQEFFNGTNVRNSNPADVRLASWLKADTVFPAAVHQNAVSRDTAHARGFLRFFGTPRNPDVVPGGELLELRVSNYPPGVRTIDSLRGLLPQSEIDKYIFLYPPYFNCQVYDVETARFLQQDTVDVGGATTATYRLRVFVQDTPPNFLTDGIKCATGVQNFVVANLTNQLRFDFDVNTDDENEDRAAVAEGWNFRYGRTTYGFPFLAAYSSTGQVTSDDVREIRPVWMQDQFLRDSARAVDNGANFLRTGNVVIRIDSNQAIELLRNPAQANSAFNLDSVFTVAVHDGHMGQNKRDMRVMVNVAPQLQPPTNLSVLPRAKEDVEYNRGVFDNRVMLDSSRRIPVTDLNFGQRVRFTLVYRDDAQNPADLQTGFSVRDSNGQLVQNTATTAFVRRDACYDEAGLFTAPKTTPTWLKINPVSGLLFGTPGLNDAPRTSAAGGPDTVTVVAIDENGLTDVRMYLLEVDSTQHRPRLFGRPAILCIDPTQAYSDELCVTDRDLGRRLFTENLRLEVISPAGFEVDQPTIDGFRLPDTVCFRVRANANAINDTGKVRVVVVVTDNANNTDTLAYEIAVSAPVLFSMPLDIRNTNPETGNAAFQRLVFGIARNATTGEEPSSLGRLDSLYCEYELPPLPPRDVFDSRWTVPSVNGTLRNIFPEVPQAGQGLLSWKGSFQPGFLPGGSTNYPIYLCWSITDAQRAPRNIHIMDQVGGSVFRVDMKNPRDRGVRIAPGSGVILRITGDTACVEIVQTAGVTGFLITYDITSKVEEEPTTGVAGYSLSANVPNPFASSTEISFYAPKRDDVRLEVYNLQGELVKTLVNGTVDAGQNHVVWNGTDEKGRTVASGTYTYRLTAGSTVLTRTMLLVK